MINQKTKKELGIMKKGGSILAEVLKIVLDNTGKGIRLSELDQLAEQEILKRGAKPSFKMVKGYNWTICACVNEEVVHGVPRDYNIRPGDLISIDCGVYFKGFHTDAAWTKLISKDKKNNSKKIQQFLQTGKNALLSSIKKVKVGNYIYDISSEIQNTVEKKDYSVVKTLVGHGVGKKLHESPEVPCFVRQERKKTPKIVDGMVLAIEVIYNMGGANIIYKNDDGWTISTKDGKISGLFEATVAATNHGCLVLTPLEGIPSKLME